MRSGRRGGVGGIPPAEPVNEISSDIFKYTPPDVSEQLTKKHLRVSSVSLLPPKPFKGALVNAVRFGSHKNTVVDENRRGSV